MNKFNLNKPITHPAGFPFKNEDGSEFLIKDAILNGLSSNDQNATAQQKTKRYELALKVVAFSGECELSSSDITEINKSIEKMPPFIYGFVSKFLG